jgi:signal transduction histidine kinase
VRAIKQFAHPDTAEKVQLDLHQAIETTLTVSRNEWKHVAEVVTEFDRTLPPIWGYPGEIHQALLNVIVNAAHAVEEKIAGRASQSGKGTITVRTRRNGGWAEVQIADTGIGIKPEHPAKVFDPFFTTKRLGKGTGQGLTIARAAVVTKHGGEITFTSTVGEGTTFFIRLPFGEPREGPAGHNHASGETLSTLR